MNISRSSLRRPAFVLAAAGFSLVAAFASPALAAPGARPTPVSAASAGAPDVPDRLDLQNAIAYALENNFSIRQARERIREQEGLIVEIKSRALPNASLNSFYGKTADELGSDRGPGITSSQNWQIALEVRQTLYSGGGIKNALDAQKLARESSLL